MYNKKAYNLGANASAIRELFEYGKEQKEKVGAGNVFDYSIGNPNCHTPEIVKEKINYLLNEKDSYTVHSYTSSCGDEIAREAIANFLDKKYNANSDKDLIYLTCGAAAALAITFNAISEENNEVIIISPYFPEYKIFIENASMKCVISKSDKNFQIDIKNIDKLINKNTKAIVINSPNNPSGVVYKESIIRELARLLKKKEQEFNKTIYLISDEPYRELIYEDIKYPFITNYYDDSIICYSFSKVLSLPGERIGYILISKKCADSQGLYKAICGSGRMLGYVCAPSLFQHLIPYILPYTVDINVYKENRDLLYNNLIKLGYKVIYPNGAFYMFVEALEKDSIKFSNKAKEYNLLLVPSDSFGIKGYVRMSYCVSKEMIEKSLPALKKLIDYYGEKNEV